MFKMLWNILTLMVYAYSLATLFMLAIQWMNLLVSAIFRPRHR